MRPQQQLSRLPVHSSASSHCCSGRGAVGRPPLISRLSCWLSCAHLADLDVRTVEEFAAGHAPGAINIPILTAGPFGEGGHRSFKS